MKLQEIAERITPYLKRFEADEDWNKVEWESRTHGPQTGSKLYNAHASWPGGRYVAVTYISYQGSRNLTKAEALAYLHWLEAGGKGRHTDMPSEQQGEVG